MDAVGTLQLLPSGLAVPPLPYLLVLAGAGLAVGGALLRIGPPVTGQTVVAFVPWMAAGAALHALYQVGGAPPLLRPLFGAPAVYATTFLAAGAVWVLAARTGPTTAVLCGVGAAAGLLAGGSVLWTGLVRGTLALALPVVGLVASVAVAAGTYRLLGELDPGAVAAVGAAGPVVVFGHALDGVSTAVGVDLLGAGERSPLPRAILGAAEALPTASVIGTGWLFVLVKVAIAAVVLWLFADVVDEDPDTGYALLGVVAAVGLGPGAHNLLLFAAAGV